MVQLCGIRHRLDLLQANRHAAYNDWSQGSNNMPRILAEMEQQSEDLTTEIRSTRAELSRVAALKK